MNIDLDDLWDAILFACLLLGVVLGVRIFPVFALALVFPYIFSPKRMLGTFARLGRPELFLLGVLAAFSTYFCVMAWVHWVPYDDVLIFRPRGMDHPGEWMALLLVGALTLLRLMEMRDLKGFMDRMFLPLLCLSFAFAVFIYCLYYAEVGPIYSACRTGAATFNPNVFAFLMAMLLGVGFAYKLAVAPQSRSPWIILGAGAFFLLFLTISRMAAISFVLTSLVVAALMPGSRLRNFGLTLGVLIVSLGAAFAVIELLGCGVLERFNRLADVTNMETSRSTARRFELWGISLEALKGNWLWGLGPMQDAALSYPNAHIHNQYLSWAVWGGWPGAVLGTVLLLSLPIYGWLKARLTGFVIAGGMMGFAGLNLFADSILYFADPYAQFLIYFAFGAAVVHSYAQREN